MRITRWIVMVTSCDAVPSKDVIVNVAVRVSFDSEVDHVLVVFVEIEGPASVWVVVERPDVLVNCHACENALTRVRIGNL